MTVIVTQLFLLKVEDEKTMLSIVRTFPTTPAFSHIQKYVLGVEISPVRTTDRGGGFKLFRSDIRGTCGVIIDGAVRSLFET